MIGKYCKECGQQIPAESRNTTFCSYKCSRKSYRKKAKAKGGVEHLPPPNGVTVLTTFICKNCGHNVKVWQKEDRRRVFCSLACERQWWRDETRHDKVVHRRVER